MTNYSNGKSSETCILSIYEQKFRQQLLANGFPIGSKSLIAREPLSKFEIKDFYRGVIDGDGSLGFTKTGIPFLSFVTKSELLKESYCKYLNQVLGIKKNVNRNKRDEIYNICLYREDAILFAEHLYKNSCNLSIKRKYDNYKKMIL